MFDLLYFDIANIIEIFVFAKYLQTKLRAKCIFNISAVRCYVINECKRLNISA